jgi:hypothetical protein
MTCCAGVRKIVFSAAPAALWASAHKHAAIATAPIAVSSFSRYDPPARMMYSRLSNRLNARDKLAQADGDAPPKYVW